MDTNSKQSIDEENSDSSTFILKIPKEEIKILLDQFRDTNKICYQELSPNLFRKEDYSKRQVSSNSNYVKNQEKPSSSIYTEPVALPSVSTNPFLMPAPQETINSEQFLAKVIEKTASYTRKNTNPFLTSEEDTLNDNNSIGCNDINNVCDYSNSTSDLSAFNESIISNSHIELNRFSSPLNSPVLEDVYPSSNSPYDNSVSSYISNKSDTEYCNNSEEKIVQLEELLTKVDIKHEQFLLNDSLPSSKNLSENYEENFLKMSMTENEYQIENYFDKASFKVGDFIKLRVSNTYDPTKFWIVTKYKELEYFMEYLLEFYTKHEKDFKINNVACNLYCVVYCQSLYFRAVIVSLLVNIPQTAKVFLFDYGVTVIVSISDIYYLSEKMYQVPQFAVRASLAYIRPRYNITWTTEVVRRLDELINCRVLIAQIVGINKKYKTIQLNLGEVTDDSPTIWYVNKTLIEEGYAKYIFEKNDPPDPNSKFITKVKYLYLFPSFEMIEIGNVPFSAFQNETLQCSVQTDTLFKQYFQYKS